MQVGWMAWTTLGVAVVVMLVMDLVLFGRRSKGETIPFRTAAIWSAVWLAIGLLFTFVIVWMDSGEAGHEYLAGFLLEKSLSMDNVFVFAMLFAYFQVPGPLQRRVIFWGIVGAIVLRGIFIVAGTQLLDTFHWMIYVFGAFLLITAVRMVKEDDDDIDPSKTLAMRIFRRIIPFTNKYDGDRFVTRRAGHRVATPLVAAFLMVAAFDLLFALDSIPAILSITRDTYVVASANAMSLLGMTALYFLLANMIDRFEYLNWGLAIVLAFVGLKMIFEWAIHIDPLVSLAVIVVVLAVTILLSMLKTRRDSDDPPEGGGPQPTPTAADTDHPS